MKEDNIKINYETIGVMQQRNLIESTKNLCRVLTKEEYILIMSVYKIALDRVVNEAEKQGINI